MRVGGLLHGARRVRGHGKRDLGRVILDAATRPGYYAFGALAFQLVFDVAAAYSLSKLRPALGNVVLFLMLATLMLIAASAMAAVPTIVFFLIFQRNIMAGLTAGGIRG